MTFLRPPKSSAAEESLTRAIQRVRMRYNGNFDAFFEDYQHEIAGDTRQQELPLEQVLPSAVQHEGRQSD